MNYWDEHPWEEKGEYAEISYRTFIKKFGPNSKNPDGTGFACPDGDLLPRWFNYNDSWGRVGLWEFKEGASNEDAILKGSQHMTFKLLNEICESSTLRHRWLGVTVFWSDSWPLLLQGLDVEIRMNNQPITREEFIDILWGRSPPEKYDFKNPRQILSSSAPIKEPQEQQREQQAPRKSSLEELFWSNP